MVLSLSFFCRPFALTNLYEFPRCQVSARTVRPVVTVIQSPSLDFRLRVFDGEELIHVQASSYNWPASHCSVVFRLALAAIRRTGELHQVAGHEDTDLITLGTPADQRQNV